MKNTKNRQKIINILEKGGAYTASSLHKKLPEMDLATIYRNLNLFTKEGIVTEILISKGESMYEIIHEDHGHAMCNKCGKVLHVEVDKEKIKKALKLEGFEIEDIELNIKGHCKD